MPPVSRDNKPHFLLRHQSSPRSISCARSSGVWYCLKGSIPSILRNTPVGSAMASSVPLFRSQFITLSRSLDLCSIVRRETGILGTVIKSVPCSSAVGLASFSRSQSKDPSISRARSSEVCPRFFGNIASSLRNSPLGSKVASSTPLFRSQVKASVMSFDLCSGVRFPTKVVLPSSEPIGKSSRSMPLFLIQSKAISISFARSSRTWLGFLSSKELTFSNSPVGSVKSLFFPLLRSQLMASCWFFNLCSGVCLDTGTAPSFESFSTTLSSVKEMPLCRM